ncbi:hypothetical protein T05_5656 [Trichinella murrelli]|uniref:Uncharacterized protein n=1 Tax=Trichinella murrelli TaxID=144512 RepID=A0A0V0ST71_9BILA|nr:hypothetical protein T05_5656 [Trichinella murrelli]
MNLLRYNRDQVPNKSGSCCYRCKGNHHPSKCKFISEACRFCKRIGHIELPHLLCPTSPVFVSTKSVDVSLSLLSLDSSLAKDS